MGYYSRGLKAGLKEGKGGRVTKPLGTVNKYGDRFIRPVGIEFGERGQGWGAPRAYRDGVHEGIDYRVPEGTPVMAVAPGTVVRVVSDIHGPEGKYIRLVHMPEGYLTDYMHLSRIDVKEGEFVSQGEVVGLSGSSGILRSAAHLHFQVLWPRRMLLDYVKLFGKPMKWGTNRAEFVGVPAEPFLPVG